MVVRSLIRKYDVIADVWPKNRIKTSASAETRSADANSARSRQSLGIRCPRRRAPRRQGRRQDRVELRAISAGTERRLTGQLSTVETRAACTDQTPARRGQRIGSPTYREGWSAQVTCSQMRANIATERAGHSANIRQLQAKGFSL